MLFYLRSLRPLIAIQLLLRQRGQVQRKAADTLELTGTNYETDRARGLAAPYKSNERGQAGPKDIRRHLASGILATVFAFLQRHKSALLADP
jgi:hypothetical protein